MELDRLCMGCMEDRGDTHICSRCGYEEGRITSIVALPPRTELNQQYLMGRVLGSPGGFGITYLAWDISLATPVAIKEYKPRGLVERAPDRLTVLPQSQEDEALFHTGLKQFLEEARLLAQLAQLNHPNIVRVRTFFEANGTGYMVMDYYRGMDLAELTKQNGKLQAKTARWVMMPILEGLRAVHERGVLHRDIKPQNIYITERKQPVLLDFGAARVVLNAQSRGLTAVRTPGYAPYEQEVGGKQGPWTDIYACGATLYFLLSGKVPPPALDRRARDELVPLEHLVSTVPSGLSDAIMQALAVEPEQRPQDVQTFQALLMRDGELTTSMATLPPTVASIIATCPNCNVTNSVPAGRALADTKCAQCGSMLSGPVTTSAPTNVSTQQIGVYPTFFAMATRKGQSIAAATAVVLLLLGGGLWAKQSYDKSLAEEQTKRMVLEQELKQKELEAKKAEEARLLAAEQERKQQEETEKRQLKEQIEQLAAAQQKLEAEKQKAAERPNAAAAPAAPVDPEVADMRRERQLAEERARKEEATRKAEIARERREEQRRERAEIRRKERELAEAESKLRTQSSSTAPAALPGKSRDETGALDSMTDMACKFLGTCDPRFRSNNK
jgi:serine/threonine protein kinase